MIAERPLVTKAVVMAIGLASGDLLAKMATCTGVFHDFARTISMGLFGLLFQGPALHFLYNTLDAKIVPEEPTSVKAVVAKTLIDQTMFAPVSLGVFLLSMELLSGSSPAAAFTVLKTKWFQTLCTSYAIWPAAIALNYALCPPRHRIIFVNVVNVIWSAILSVLTR